MPFRVIDSCPLRMWQLTIYIHDCEQGCNATVEHYLSDSRTLHISVLTIAQLWQMTIGHVTVAHFKHDSWPIAYLTVDHCISDSWQLHIWQLTIAYLTVEHTYLDSLIITSTLVSVYQVFSRLEQVLQSLIVSVQLCFESLMFLMLTLDVSWVGHWLIPD